MLKKIFSLILCFIMLITNVSCESKNSNSDFKISKYSTENKTTKIIPNTDLTGELNVSFLSSATSVQIDKVVSLFEKNYPNVVLKVDDGLPVDGEKLDNDDFVNEYKKLMTELMSGKGPDIFPAGGEVIDPYKSIMSGAYMDLTEYFEEDINFNIDDFNKNVIYSTQFDGKQYIIPYSFDIPIIITTQSIIDETGFDISKCKDYFSTADEIARVIKENKLNITNEKKQIINCGIPRNFLNYSGIEWIDYKSGEANLLTDDVKKGYESYKNDFAKYTFGYGDFDYMSKLAAQELSEKKALFYCSEYNNIFDLIMNAQALESLNQEIVFFLGVI